MTIEGTISAIMETMPPDLVIEAVSGRWDVAIMEDTQVFLSGQPGSFGDFVPGQRVRISGESAASGSLTASRVEIKG